MKRANRLTLAIASLLIVVMLAACVPPAPVQPAPDEQVAGLGVNEMVVTAITVRNDANVKGSLNVDGALSVDGATALSGGVVGDVTGNVLADDWLSISAQTAISVTAGAIITPTGTYQPLTSAAPVTTSTTTAVANGAVTGRLLILRNANAADAITIDGTGGNVECKANVALGAGDTLTLIWNGTDWNCISSYDNS